ncbi:hypothetical protein C8J57DRAFT_1585723 [Mycena rebaudengoi]|nr:hypothetical protein C8J57DRAFT_1585723 [Mycena rebaudengoi]
MLSRLTIALAAALVSLSTGAEAVLTNCAVCPPTLLYQGFTRTLTVPTAATCSYREADGHVTSTNTRYSYKTRGPLHTNEGEIPARFSRHVDVDTLIRQGHTGYIPVESFNTQFGYCVLEHFKAPLSPAPSFLGMCGIKRELEVIDKKYGVREKKVKEERKDVGV